MSGPSPRRTARSLSLSLASLFPFHQPVTVDHRHPRDREGESTVDRVYVARGRAPPEAEGPAAAILTGPERAVAAGSAVKQHEGGKAKATHRHRPTTTARESPPTRGPAMCLPGSFRSRRHGAHEGRGALLRPRSARGRGGGTPSLVGVGLVSFACTTPPKRGTVRASPSSSAEEVCGFFFFAGRDELMDRSGDAAHAASACMHGNTCSRASSC